MTLVISQLINQLFFEYKDSRKVQPRKIIIIEHIN